MSSAEHDNRLQRSSSGVPDGSSSLSGSKRPRVSTACEPCRTCQAARQVIVGSRRSPVTRPQPSLPALPRNNSSFTRHVRRAAHGLMADASGSRKLGCDGLRPCARCISEGRQCAFEERPERTPLTRARMSELEDKCAVAAVSRFFALIVDWTVSRRYGQTSYRASQCRRCTA